MYNTSCSDIGRILSGEESERSEVAGGREETYAEPVRCISVVAKVLYIEVAIFIRSLDERTSASRIKSSGRNITHLTGNVSISNPPNRLSTKVAAAFPNCRRRHDPISSRPREEEAMTGSWRLTIAGNGPRTGKILTRKFAMGLSSSTFPFWNSASSSGRSPISARGFSVEY